MSKGLYYCSRCKAHFYDAEATKMHVQDKHGGKGEVLRHPTKRELLIRDEQRSNRIKALEAENARLKEALQDVINHCRNQGRGSDMVNDRIIERCEDTAAQALTGSADGRDIAEMIRNRGGEDG